eukprot:1032293-Pelagomonas_calceolata.AAC.1
MFASSSSGAIRDPWLIAKPATNPYRFFCIEWGTIQRDNCIEVVTRGGAPVIQAGWKHQFKLQQSKASCQTANLPGFGGLLELGQVQLSSPVRQAGPGS